MLLLPAYDLKPVLPCCLLPLCLLCEVRVAMMCSRVQVHNGPTEIRINLASMWNAVCLSLLLE
jgi:hypothetical protein